MMRFTDLFRLVSHSIAASRMRSWLTALGISIGIASVALLTSIGEGVRFYVMDNFSQFGTRIIAIHPGKTMTHGLSGMLSSTRPLSLEDAESLYSLPYVEAIAPIVQGAGTMEYKERSRKSDIIGGGYQTADAWSFKVSAGRFLPEDQSGHSRPYVVLGHKMKQELFGNENPLGKLMRVGGQRFRVIGVMEKKGQMLGFDLDDIVYIPVDKALQIFNREGLMEVDVVFSAATSSERMSEIIRKHLTSRHGSEDFTITTQDEMLSSLDNILSVLTLGVAALGSISLFVGGVGILTIMTTSVLERTNEIGLLRAMGATQRQIQILFLSEATILSFIGGVLGLLLMALIFALMRIVVPELPVIPNPLYLLAALLLSALVGLIAGFVPSYRAAMLDPIDALRAE